MFERATDDRYSSRPHHRRRRSASFGNGVANFVTLADGSGKLLKAGQFGGLLGGDLSVALPGVTPLFRRLLDRDQHGSTAITDTIGTVTFDVDGGPYLHVSAEAASLTVFGRRSQQLRLHADDTVGGVRFARLSVDGVLSLADGQIEVDVDGDLGNLSADAVGDSSWAGASTSDSRTFRSPDGSGCS